MRFWEERYRSVERVWSGRVNPRVAEVAAGLPVGRALDLGCGEGADALWLAERGWEVVAVDISATALQRATEAASVRNILAHIDFQRHDLNESFPDGTFDLVSAQYLHSPARLERDGVLQRASERVNRRWCAVDRRPWRAPAMGASITITTSPVSRRSSRRCTWTRRAGRGCEPRPSTAKWSVRTGKSERWPTTSWFCGERDSPAYAAS